MKQLREAIRVIWAIWRARNVLIWDQNVTAVIIVIIFVKMVLDQWKFTQSSKFDSLVNHLNSSSNNECWTKYVIYTIKINVDGTLFVEEGKFDFAGVAHRVVIETNCFVVVQAV